jgi:alpha-D-xyloside xylohydrolase
MHFKFSYIFFLTMVTFGLFTACSGELDHQTIHDGVVVDLPEGKMKLKVCRDDIIRVMISPSDSFSTRESLMVIEDAWPETAFNTEVKDGKLLLHTQKITASVDLTTAQLIFYDKQGNEILAEREGGGRQIDSLTINGEETFSIRQQWKSGEGEFIHGLGHHQNGEFNLNGVDIDLWQENWNVVVPFFTSSKGYGILWDNYSHSKWGFPVTPRYIDPLQLYDAEGQPGGLTGHYFDGAGFDEVKTTRRDSIINFDFKTFGPQTDNSFTTDPDWESQPLNDEIDPSKYSVRWEGQVKSLHKGIYTFHTFCTHDVRLWVDDELLVDGWNTSDMYLEGKTHLEENTMYSIRMEWSKDDDHPLNQPSNGAVQLRWAPPAQESYDGISLWSEVGDMIDYYFMYGPELDDVISGYREATGKAPMFGRYAYGYWHSHIDIQSQQEYLEMIGEFRSREIPLDILVQDLNYWTPEPWGSHHFNPERYPDPEGMIEAAHENNIKYMISVWGMFQEGSENWKELMEKDLLFRYNNASFWTDNGTWYFNPFSEEGRQVYWNQMKEDLFDRGVDAWWLDASEPEISTPADPFLYKEVMDNNLGSGARYLNAFSLMQTKAIYEGQRETAPDERVLILGRSAYAGQQRNATVIWTGDIDGTWEVFRDQIKCGLNFNLSGIPYWTTDIGGFFINKPDWPSLNRDPGYRELYTRWFQYGVFSPVLRTHGCGPRREMWIMGDQSYKIQKEFVNLRYRLLPYIYSMAGKITHDDYTLMRPLVMDFRNDLKALEVTDQFMFGESFLVCPVTEPGMTSKEIYLPQGTAWVDFWTGESFEGGQDLDYQTPLDILPLFVKAGSVVPMGPFVQYASEKTDAPLEIRIYAGADGAFVLYEDEGENYNYEQGVFSNIEFKWNDANRELTIDTRQGAFEGMPENRIFNVVIVDPFNGTGIDQGKAAKSIEYNGTRVTAGFDDPEEDSDIIYVENDIRISPRRNVYDKSQPRNLIVVAHHPDTRLTSVSFNNRKIDYDIFEFEDLKADGQNLKLPFTSKVELSQSLFDTLQPGHHNFEFQFEDGSIRNYKLEVVDDETKGDYDLTIINFNVGHGTSVFIKINDKNILVDTGPNDMTKKRVVPFLKNMGIERIDYVLLTHWHWDHVSGLASIDRGLNLDEFSRAALRWFDADNCTEGFEIGEIWYNLTDGETTGFHEMAGEKESGRDHSEIFRVGNEFKIEGANFKVLNASRFDSEKYPEYRTGNFGRYDNKNNRSLAFRLEYEDFVYSHGGDTYQHAQEAVLKTFGEDTVRAHVYHGNHHFHGGLSVTYLKTIDPFLFITPAEAAAYNRSAYVEQVMGNVVPYLKKHSERFIENLFDFEVGHIVIKANNSEDWKYETYAVE